MSFQIDPKIKEVFADLNRRNSMGFSLVTDKGEIVPEYAAQYASVRQIARELEQTLRENCADLVN